MNHVYPKENVQLVEDDTIFNPFDSTGNVIKTNRNEEPMISQRIRPRRNRKSSSIRSMLSETAISPK